MYVLSVNEIVEGAMITFQPLYQFFLWDTLYRWDCQGCPEPQCTPRRRDRGRVSSRRPAPGERCRRSPWRTARSCAPRCRAYTRTRPSRSRRCRRGCCSCMGRTWRRGRHYSRGSNRACTVGRTGPGILQGIRNARSWDFIPFCCDQFQILHKLLHILLHSIS